MYFPTINGLTPQEQALFVAMVDVWSRNLSENHNKALHYAGKVDVSTLDLGISTPPPIVKRLSTQSVMWTHKAVMSLGDCSTFDGYAFLNDEAPEGFNDVMDFNTIDALYDEAKISELIHCSSFWTVTQGQDGELPVIINAYDAEHATALWDMRNKRILCGMAVIDVDPKHTERPTAINMYTNDSVIECVQAQNGWTTKRYAHQVGRPLMEPMRFNPMLGKPFGRSLITPAAMQIENNACREVVKMIMHSELYTAPTRWVMGAPEDIFENGKWDAYMGSIFALSRDDNGDAATTGSYPVGDMTPHISLMRQYANMFAAESNIPVHSLLYTEANPTSEGAIIAGNADLVKRAEQMNARNGEAMRNVGLLATSLLTSTPFYALDKQVRSMKVRWKNPAHTSISANADAWVKLASYAQFLPQSRVFWEQQGLDEPTVDRIMSDMTKANAQATLSALFGGGNDTNTASEQLQPSGEQDSANSAE